MDLYTITVNFLHNYCITHFRYLVFNGIDINFAYILRHCLGNKKLSWEYTVLCSALVLIVLRHSLPAFVP